MEKRRNFKSKYCELIYGLHYDYKQDTGDIILHYQKKYGITSPKMNTFEAYTEIWAELLHCYLLSKLSTKHSYDLFSANIGIEIKFSQLQSNKVLSLLEKNKDLNKETNVTSYYLIKTELWIHLNNFIEYCMRFNQNMIKLIDKDKFPDYLKKLPKVVKKKMKVSGYLKDTTRMTCLEMELF